MYARYCKLRDEKGVKDATVARETGIPRSTFTDWKNGRSQPKNDKIQRIADYFGVTVDYFTNDTTSGQSESYYLNQETAEIAQEVFDNPDLRILFDAARDAKPESLQFAAELLRKFKETNPDG